MGDQSSDFTSDIISETSLSSARSSLTYQSCSETSYADSLSTSISAREILSAPNLEGFSFNELENAITSFRFDSLLGEGGFGSSARSSLIARSSSETSYAESYSTSIFEGGKLSGPKPKAFQLNVLKEASDCFGNNSCLGIGRYGIVFKGWIDEETLAATKPGSGIVVAIKKHTAESFLGYEESLDKVNYWGQLHHPNLVKLIGYCLDGENRLLVYEFMPKGSLEDHLFRREIQPLSWEMRIKVAIGAARGLFFLHEAKAIHGNFKASNILLDAEFDVKLSDFYWPKANPTSDCPYRGLMGPNCDCPGDCAHGLYTAPYVNAAREYDATGDISAKVNVYNFRFVLLELLSGRRAVDNSKVGVEQFLVDWAKPYLGNKQKLFRMMDPKLEGHYPQKGAFMVATLALQCLDTKASRPRMTEVLNTLESLQAPKVVAHHSN